MNFSEAFALMKRGEKVYMRLYEALRYALRRGIVNKRQSFCFALEVWHINYSVPHRAGI